MMIGATLVDVVNHWATIQPEHKAYTFLNAESEEVDHITYGELRRKALAVAAQLSQRDIHSSNAILMYPAGIDFIVGFLGCIYAGVAPAPVHTPKRNRSNRKIFEIIKHADAAVLLSDCKTLDELERIRQQEQGWPVDITCLATDTIGSRYDNLLLPVIPAEAVAFLQFTSGSTSLPKGVMISHRNCLYNLRMMQTVHQASPASIFVSWLPHYHDLGLGTHLLGNLYCGSHCVLLAPTTFLFQPVQWLRAITNYQAHHTGAPNFAYRLCTDRISEQDKRGLDLSSLKMAINAAEPVDSQTIIDFTARFADVGFKSNTFLPAYGMAEATVFITSRELKDEPVLKHCDWDALINEKTAKPAAEGAKTKTFVGCGVTWLEQDIRIVDPASGIEVPRNHIGEIWISGPNIMVGYYNNEQATAETFAHLPDSDRKYLRTGDLGFIDETDELYIAGRLKDMIIINGVNYYPQDIEVIVEKAHADIRPGCTAAFSVTQAAGEQLVITAELKEQGLQRLQQDPSYLQQLAEQLCATVGHHLDISLSHIVFLKPYQIPKTSSGKIRRQECKGNFITGNLTAVAVWPETKVTQTTYRDVAMLNIEKTLELVTSMGPLHLKVFSTIMPILTKKYNVRMADFDVNKSIFFYGIDSIKIIDIHSELEKTLKCAIPTVAFFEANTFIAMIDDIVKSITGERLSHEVTDNAATLQKEIATHTSRLPQLYSTARQTLADSSRQYGNRFLTGASGFVGGYLLKELLDATDDVVYCLVRAKDEPAGMQRILSNAKKYNIKFPSGGTDRIKPVVGDASKPCFGLSEEAYGQLAEMLDSIYHCAAVDNFYLPYSVLKNTNVFGTMEIAAFAMTRKLKPVYYISSCAANLINDDLSDFSVVGLVNGYAQTKFVAEKIIRHLIAQGFPAMNFRLGYLYSLRLEQIDEQASFEQMLTAVRKAYSNLDESVLGDEDAFENFLAAIPKIGAVPALNAVFDLMPVEYAAKSIVATSLQEAAADKAEYTFYNPCPLQWSDLVDYFKRHYRRMEVVPLDIFIERFQEYARATEKKSIKLLKSVVSPELESQINRMFAGIDMDRVDAFKRWCPPCDRRFTEHYIDFAING